MEGPRGSSGGGGVGYLSFCVRLGSGVAVVVVVKNDAPVVERPREEDRGWLAVLLLEEMDC